MEITTANAGVQKSWLGWKLFGAAQGSGNSQG